MLWKNEEQYEDYTAGRAMFHVMVPDAGRSDALDDNGCMLLTVAILRRAAADHAAARRLLPNPDAVRRMEETEAFFCSDFCRLVTGMQGKKLLRMMEKEMEVL